MNGVKKAKRCKRYGFHDAVERLQHIRQAIAREEVKLHGQEWAVSKTKHTIARLEYDREKVHRGIVIRP